MTNIREKKIQDYSLCVPKIQRGKICRAFQNKKDKIYDLLIKAIEQDNFLINFTHEEDLMVMIDDTKRCLDACK